MGKMDPEEIHKPDIISPPIKIQRLNLHFAHPRASSIKLTKPISFPNISWSGMLVQRKNNTDVIVRVVSMPNIQHKGIGNWFIWLRTVIDRSVSEQCCSFKAYNACTRRRLPDHGSLRENSKEHLDWEWKMKVKTEKTTTHSNVAIKIDFYFEKLNIKICSAILKPAFILRSFQF